MKYDKDYLKDYENIRDARRQIVNFIHGYNFEKLHSALGYQIPAKNYNSVLMTQVCSKITWKYQVH
ncbi:integrase core domain-containing protein [Caproicibacterium sp. XB1]|uniref:integrase core domain-containing protein n=1 Tax=Caproicibacterium sp. XB1 TaxID=3396405 RepID=UPI0039B6ED44